MQINATKPRCAFYHNTRQLLSLVSELFLVTITLYICTISEKNVFTFVFYSLILSIQFQRLSMLAHEATHFNLNSNSWINDFLTEVLIAAPLGGSLKNYRIFHFAHHKYNGSSLVDPEILGWRSLKLTQFLVAPLVTRIKILYLSTNPTLSSFSLFALIHWLAIFLMCFILKSNTIYIYICTVFVTFPILSRYRSFLEHDRSLKLHPPRNFSGHWIKMFVLFPYNGAQHKFHHQNPDLPWYLLPAKTE